MADEVLTQIEEKVKRNKVMLYMKGTPEFPQCGFSAHTVEILKSYGRPFHRSISTENSSAAAISFMSFMSAANSSRCSSPLSVSNFSVPAGI
jgi:Glutaredoxin